MLDARAVVLVVMVVCLFGCCLVVVWLLFVWLLVAWLLCVMLSFAVARVVVSLRFEGALGM